MRFLIILLVVLSGQVFAQSPELEGLLNQVKRTPQDTSKVNLLCKVGKQYLLTDAKTGMQFAKEAQTLANHLHYAKGEAKATSLIGNGHLVLGEYDKAFPFYFASLKIGEQTKDTALLIATYNSLGVLCFKTKDEKRALQHYATSEKLALKTNNKRGLAKVYNNLGNVYESNEEYAKALAFFKKAAKIEQSLGDQKNYAVGLLNIGNVYTLIKKPMIGLPFLREALEIDKELHNNMNMTVTLNCLAKAFMAMGQTDTALVYSQKSYKVAVQTESGKKISSAAKLLASIYAAKKDFEQAYAYQEIVTQQDSKLNKERQSQAAAEIISKFEHNKQELENLNLKAQRRLHDVEAKQQKIIMYFEGGILLLLSLLVIGLFFSKQHFKSLSRRLQEATGLLQQRNQEITSQKEEISKHSSILALKNDQLDRHNSFKSKVFSIISHDLRSPFNSIQGILQLMQNRTLKEGEVKRIFDALSNNMEVVVNMMNNLLGWSKAQMQGSSLEMHSLELNEFLEQNLQIMREQASPKNVQLVNLFQDSLTILTDKERLAFLLRNLLANAIKFSYENSTVTVDVEQIASGVSILVSDTGKGIAKENLSKLFSENRFTTLGTSKEVGTGLGLMLCKELVESLSGEISVHSVENKGSTFTIYLPCTFLQETEIIEETNQQLVMA